MNLSTARNFAVALICALFIGIAPVRSADDPATIRHKIDSLKRAMPDVKKEHQRFTCMKIVSLYTGLGEPDELRKYLNESVQYARNMGDTIMEGMVIVKRVSFFGNHDMADSLRGFIDRDLDFLARTGQWDFRFFCHSSWVSTLMFNGNMDEALAEANKMYRFAKEQKQNNGIGLALSAIGKVSQGMSKSDEAASAYREALGYFEGNNKYGFILNTTRDLCMVLFEQERYEEALQRCTDAEKVLEEGMKLPGKMDFTSQQFNLYWQFAVSYLGLNNVGQAEKYLALMKKSPTAAMSLGKRTIDSVEWKVYKAKGDFPRALEAIEKHYRNQLAEGAGMDAHYTLTNLAQVAKQAGDYRRSSDAFELIVIQNDSIRSLENLTALDELRTVYEVDKLEAQKQARENYLLLSAGIIVLLAGLLAVWMAYARRIRRKNVALYHQIRELLQSQRQAEEVLLATPEEALSRGMQLFRRVGELMQAEKLFTDPELNRKTLADRLGTNEAYLADAIREATGQTFSAYIAGLRLGYSLELLGGRDELTLDAVAVDSGHGSYSSFFRAFTKQYGISPSEYRRLSAVKEP